MSVAARYSSRRTGDGGPGTRWDYEGPHGPLSVTYGDGETQARVAGPSVGEGRLSFRTPPGSGASPLREGVVAHFTGAHVRLSRDRGGLTRASRSIRVTRPDAVRDLRLRGWDTASLESGRWLVRGDRAGGEVAPEAEPLDIGVFLLVDAAGLTRQLRLNLL